MLNEHINLFCQIQTSQLGGPLYSDTSTSLLSASDVLDILTSVTRLGDFLHFGQLLKPLTNN